MATPLYEYQQDGVRRLEESGLRTYLCDAPGLGKTIQALTCIKNHPELWPVVIVCPASVKGVWQRQAAEHTGLRVDILESTRAAKRPGIVKPKIIIINFDILYAWLPYLIALKPGLVIADESHRLKGQSTRVTKSMRTLIAGVKCFIPMSGTPLTVRPIDLFPVLQMLWPKKFKSRLKFGIRYCGGKRTRFGWDFNGATRIKALNRLLLKMGMIRRLKKDVLKDLPDRRNLAVPLNLSPRAKAEYDRAHADIRGWFKDNYKGGKLERSLRIEALAKMNALMDLATKLTLDQRKEWIADFLASGEKLIAFCTRTKTLKEVQNAHPGCAMVNGSVTGEKRTTEFERFNTSKACRLMVGNLKAAGTGWSARKCSNVVNLEIGWEPGDHTQAGDRVHGIGRGQEGVQATMWWLVAAGTIEEVLYKAIIQKSKTVDGILDGRVVERFDLLEDMMKSMTK